MINTELKNYRVTFLKSLDDTTDYWKDFPAVTKWYPVIRQITDYAKKIEIEYIWFFYEPFIEITWLTKSKIKSEALVGYIQFLATRYKITDVKEFGPEDGDFADWFCQTDREREFGGKRHDICRQWVDLYYDYKDDVDKGKGLKEQVKRTIHTLCNPLALNFKDEGKIALSRAIACLLFIYVKPRWLALFIYKKIFRQKY